MPKSINVIKVVVMQKEWKCLNCGKEIDEQYVTMYKMMNEKDAHICYECSSKMFNQYKTAVSSKNQLDWCL